MVRKLLPLLAALAVLLVAAGGVAAASDIGGSDELTDNDAEGADDNAGHGNDEADDTSDAEVGICVVGVDSPCNGDSRTNADQETATGEKTSEGDGQMWIPEDQNRDGQIDDRFKDDEAVHSGKAEAGICVVGADSPCNGDEGSASGEIETGTPAENDQIWIPEDQSHDGQIDDQFLPDLFRSVTLFDFFGRF